MTIKDFKEIWDQKREILSANPDECAVKVKADSRLVDGFLSRVKAREFDIVVDQNKGMGGTDQGPGPVNTCWPRWRPAMRLPIVSTPMR